MKTMKPLRERAMSMILAATLCLGADLTATTIVSVDSATIAPGDTVDLSIEITDDGSFPFGTYDFTSIQIVQTIGSTQGLVFGAAQPDYSADSDYVFFGDSSGILATINPYPHRGTGVVYSGDVISLGDNTSSFADVFVDGTKLLAKVRLHGTGAMAADVYELRPDVTLLDSRLNSVTPTGVNLSVGIVTMVPEPSSFSILLLLSYGAIAARLK